MARKVKYRLPVLSVIFYLFFSSNVFASPNLIIKRDECNGAMNTIYCDIFIERLQENCFIPYDKYSISEFDILEEPFMYTEKYLSLAGGEKIILSIQPGKYRLKCITPIEKQNKYLNEKGIWTSEYLYIELTDFSILVNIYPKIDASGYSGGWVLSNDK